MVCGSEFWAAGIRAVPRPAVGDFLGLFIASAFWSHVPVDLFGARAAHVLIQSDIMSMSQSQGNPENRRNKQKEENFRCPKKGRLTKPKGSSVLVYVQKPGAASSQA